MNKTAAAIAADSAVTIPSSRGDKVYNSANKIFTLSKYEPVGILIYNATEFTTKPWETVVKEFREHIKDGYAKNMEDYVSDFIKYLESIVPVSKDEENNNILGLALSYADLIRGDWILECGEQQIIPSDTRVRGDVRRILSNILSEERRELQKAKTANSMAGIAPVDIVKTYSDAISFGIQEAFKPHQLDKRDENRIAELFSLYICPSNVTRDIQDLRLLDMVGMNIIHLFTSLRKRGGY